ncbi:MAG TPA: chorismate synthase [Planctomycetes bacterium]|nr:chorismate synthase [Planctomycetota bacterium]
MLRFLTAGESHGVSVCALLEGLPPGLELDVEYINSRLKLRQRGHGRGARQAIEDDAVEITSGMRKGRTTGAPVLLVVCNRDSRIDETPEITVPRPGHADLAGHVKYGVGIREVLERASARDTAARVAAGAVAQLLLKRVGCTVHGRVTAIGDVEADIAPACSTSDFDGADASLVRCPDKKASEAMQKAIDAAREAGDTLGGIFEVAAFNVPTGLGSHVEWDRRADAAIGQAMLSIPAVKGVEIGPAFTNARLPGSRVHDEIVIGGGGRLERPTNRAGGMEGGITNGQPVVVRCAMKPIPTLTKPLRSIDLATGREAPAARERSDVTAVPAASVVGEAMLALVLADMLLERNGNDRLPEKSRGGII